MEMTHNFFGKNHKKLIINFFIDPKPKSLDRISYPYNSRLLVYLIMCFPHNLCVLILILLNSNKLKYSNYLILIFDFIELHNYLALLQMSTMNSILNINF